MCPTNNVRHRLSVKGVRYLANRGLTPNVALLHEIDTECTNFYKSVQRHLMQTKSGSDDLWVIDLPVLKHNKMPNSTQLSDWMQDMASTLDKATSFDGFTHSARWLCKMVVMLTTWTWTRPQHLNTDARQ